MKTKFILAAAVSLVIFACNRQGSPSAEDKPETGGILPTATQLITKMWQVSEWTAEGLEQLVSEPTQTMTIENAMQLLYDFQVDDKLLVFDRRHEYVADGNWELAQDTSVLKVSMNDDSRELQIRHFSHDHLILYWTEPTADETRIPVTVHLKPYQPNGQ